MTKSATTATISQCSGDSAPSKGTNTNVVAQHRYRYHRLNARSRAAGRCGRRARESSQSDCCEYSRSIPTGDVTPTTRDRERRRHRGPMRPLRVRDESSGTRSGEATQVTSPTEFTYRRRVSGGVPSRSARQGGV
jgi:hypothetical protein